MLGSAIRPRSTATQLVIDRSGSSNSHGGRLGMAFGLGATILNGRLEPTDLLEGSARSGRSARLGSGPPFLLPAGGLGAEEALE